MVHTETKKKLRVYLKFKLNWASFILSHSLSLFPSVSLGVRKVRNVGKVQEKQTRSAGKIIKLHRNNRNRIKCLKTISFFQVTLILIYQGCHLTLNISEGIYLLFTFSQMLYQHFIEVLPYLSCLFLNLFVSGRNGAHTE